MSEHSGERRIPVVEEQVDVDKRVVETGTVRVKTAVDERTEWIAEELVHEEVTLERVAIDREVEELPQIRQEADKVIVPVVREELVVAKRWVLVEELHLHRSRRLETQEIPVKLRSTKVSVERDPSSGDNADS